MALLGIQTDDILILVDNDFASIKKDTIRSGKIMIKNKEYLTSIYPLKFNGVQIKLDLNGIVLTKKIYVKSIFPITDYCCRLY